MFAGPQAEPIDPATGGPCSEADHPPSIFETKPQDAATALRLIEACPTSASGYYWLGYARFREGELFAAARSLEKAKQLSPKAIEVRRQLALTYFLLNQRRFFREEIAAALRIDPDDAEANYIAGRFTFEIETDYQEALSLFERASRSDSSHYKAHCYVGLCLLALKRKDEAEAALHQALAAADRQGICFDLAARSLADLALEEQRHAAALEAARRAVDCAAQIGENQYVLGKAALAAGDYSVANTAFESAIELDDSLTSARYVFAQSLRAQGRHDEAKAQLEEFQRKKALYGP